MEIRLLSDLDLISKTKQVVREEKEATEKVLDYLAEVERRRLFAHRGYPSLFEFCTKELGYSEGAAHRRISSMRLIKSLPEAKEKLALGAVNLSTLSQLQSFH